LGIVWEYTFFNQIKFITVTMPYVSFTDLSYKKDKIVASSNSNMSFHFLAFRVGRDFAGKVISAHQKQAFPL